MKRRASGQSQPAAPISAIAARRARQANIAVEKPAAGTIEPKSTGKSSSKRAKASSSSIPQKQTGISREPTHTSRNGIEVEAVDIGTSQDDDEYAVEDDNKSQSPREDGREESNLPALISEPQENFLLSKGRITRDSVVYTREDAVCLRLKLKTTLAIVGQYDIWVKRGVVSVMGAKLYPSPTVHRVYAPSTHSLPVIKSVSGPDGYAEVELISVQDGLPQLSRISNLYYRIWNGQGESTVRRNPLDLEKASFSILNSSSDDPYKRHLRPLHLDKKWSTMIKQLSRRAEYLRVLTCGPGGSGKSTFNRYLLNHLLSPSPDDASKLANEDGVAFLDLDPGQPEFSPMGHVYLAHLRAPVLGPPLSHPSLGSGDGSIIRSHHIGGSSPKDDSDHYVQCAMNLLDHYGRFLESYPQCPLIINYPGWIFGKGLEILTQFLETLGLSDVVYMSETGPEEVAWPLQSVAKEFGIPFSTLPSQPTEYASRSSGQLRTMQMVSYFHMQDACSSSSKPYWSATPLCQTRTIKVNYSGSSQGILGVMIVGYPHDKEHALDLLDGSIVGVVAIERADAIKSSSSFLTVSDRDSISDAAEGEGSTVGSPPSSTDKQTHPCLHRTERENLPYLFSGNGTCAPLDPELSYSLGLALIRSVDTASETIELISPIRSTAVRDALERGHQIVLVRGRLDNPDWAIGEEYFAARWAHRQLPQLQQRLKQQQKPESRSTQERERYIYLGRVKERLRRAGEVPWMHASGASKAESTATSHTTKSNKMWKLRKIAYSADSSSGSEQEW
ncbi:Polynucleotide 5'-hydroxyl-kinase grc3 [Microsporum audouinii]